MALQTEICARLEQLDGQVRFRGGDVAGPGEPRASREDGRHIERLPCSSPTAAVHRFHPRQRNETRILPAMGSGCCDIDDRSSAQSVCADDPHERAVLQCYRARSGGTSAADSIYAMPMIRRGLRALVHRRVLRVSRLARISTRTQTCM